MSPAIQNAILSASNSWALSALVKATFVLMLGLGVTVAARRARASYRHSILAATFAVLLALPLVATWAPSLSVVLRTARPAPSPIVNASPLRALSALPVAPPASSPWTVASVLTVMWLAGVAVFLAPIATGLRQVLRLRRSGIPWTDGQSLVDDLAPEAGIQRRVDLLLDEDLHGPMTCGVARPAILLPADATGWSSEELERALVHELAHVARWDWAIHCAGRVACALYWFHPLVWIARRRLELEAERACDDAVVLRAEPTAYADQLVATARRISASSRSPLLAMANRADLASRINAVLDRRQRRGPLGSLGVALTVLLAAVLAAGVSPLRVSAAPQADPRLPNLRTETRLVLAEATVTFPNGAVAEGLGPSDFSITEDGVEQSIRICDFDKGKGVYLLGYYPSNGRADGQFRRLNVVVKTATSAKVEFRTGYVMMQPQRVERGRVVETPAGPPLYDRPPALLFKKEPEYSEEARKAKYQGVVLVAVDIDTNGTVSGVKVVRSLGLGLDEKAIEAVKDWRFRPAEKDGHPVRAAATLEVSFRLL